MTARMACARIFAPIACGSQHSADAEVIERARRGDPSALDELVRRHQARLYNLAYRMLRQTEDAEDVTQEAFLKAFAALPRLENDLAFAAWLNRIAANLCLMRLRSRPRRVEVPADEQSREAAQPEDWSNLEQIANTRETVAKLPPKYRLAVIAFYL